MFELENTARAGSSIRSHEPPQLLRLIGVVVQQDDLEVAARALEDARKRALDELGVRDSSA